MLEMGDGEPRQQQVENESGRQGRAPAVALYVIASSPMAGLLRYYARLARAASGSPACQVVFADAERSGPAN